MSQRLLHRLLVHDEIGANETGDRLALGTFCDRRVETHQAGFIAHIPLPADPDQGDAAPHEKAVAEFVRGRGIERTFGVLYHVQHPFTAAIWDLDERRAVRMRRVFRLENVNIGRELDFARAVPRRLVEVDDGLIGGGLGFDREVHLADHLLVGAGVAECFAVEDVGARKYFHAFDARLGRNDDKRRKEKEAKTLHQGWVTGGDVRPLCLCRSS